MVSDLLKMSSSGTVYKVKSDLTKCEGAPETEFEKQVTITKTLLAALGGAEIYKILVWVCGEDFNPQLGSHIKYEPKKCRKIVNSDVVSFVKSG